MPSQGHILDGNTRHLWRLTGSAPTQIDLGSGSNNLGNLNNGTDQCPGPTNEGCGRLFRVQFQGHISAATIGNTDLNMWHSGNWTVEWWFFRTTELAANANNYGRMINAYNTTFTSFPLDNFQFACDQTPYTTGGIVAFINSGSAPAFINIVSGGTNFLTPNQWTHIGIRSTYTGGGRATYDLFRNGVLTQSNPNISVPTGGNNAKYEIGAADSLYLIGSVGDVRISSGSRTNAEILESYMRGVPATASSDVTDPQVTNLSPAASSSISPSQAISFQVTDASLLTVILAVQFTSLGTREVVHDGTNFCLNYTGGTNVRTPVSGGYSFTILRDGGWPASPQLFIDAFDTNGNEN